MRTRHFVMILVLLVIALPASPAHAGGVVTVCDEVHLRAALAGGGTVTFDCSGTIILSAEIVVATDTTIDGSGQDVTISGNHAVRVFTVNAEVILNLDRLTVASGRADYGGGALNYGTLNVSNSTFSGNSATAFQGAGGGILNFGTLTVHHSTFSNNTANQQGGGGGIDNSGVIKVANSTFTGNSADIGGAIVTGVYGSYSALIMDNSTLSNNSARSAGGIYFEAGWAILRNTIVANNQPGGNCRGKTVADGGGNLSYPGTACPGINGDPMLGPLQDNGGPTWTMALGRGSAAIDTGIDAICAADPVNNLDQRGIVRPQGAHCDIGAVEQAPYAPLPPRLWLPAVLSQS